MLSKEQSCLLQILWMQSLIWCFFPSGGSLYAPFAQFLVTSCLEDVSLDRLNRCYSINWHNNDSDLAIANPCIIGFERQWFCWRRHLCWCWFQKGVGFNIFLPLIGWSSMRTWVLVCGSTVWLSGSKTRRSRLRVVNGSAWEHLKLHGFQDFDSEFSVWQQQLEISSDIFWHFLISSKLYLHQFINLISLVETWDFFLRPLPDYVVADEEHPGLEHRSTLQLHLGSSWAADGFKGFGG